MIKCVVSLILLSVMNSAFALNVRSETVTVSGLSSGGYMAGQLHVAYSSTFKAAGILAAGPYACARGSLMTALMQCMDTYQGGPQARLLVSEARRLETQGAIDSLEELKDDRVYILAGRRDRTVMPIVIKENVKFYESLGVSQIKLRDDLEVGHAFPTLDQGNACSEVSRAPWISRCNVDIAGEMLEYLLDRKLVARTTTDRRSFFHFKQPSADSMAATGIAYIPEICRTGRGQCELHLAIHGCRQTEDETGEAYMRMTGLNEWAEANRLVIVYPRTVKSQLMGNPNGCWDWWGYTGSDYAVQSGEQMRALKSIVDSFIDQSVELSPL